TKVYPKIATEASPNLIPDGFNYYAGGHIHTPLQIPFKGGTLIYSGSTETVSYEDAYIEKGFFYVEVDGNGKVEVNRIKLEKTRKFKILDRDFTGLTPQEITEITAKLVREADEDGAVLVPILRGTLPAEAMRREVDIAMIRGAAEKALTVHPLMFLREETIPEETIRGIFEDEMKDLKAKSYEYFLQFFLQRYGREESEKRARIALDLIQFLVKEDDEEVKKVLESVIDED
ncbi:MAG: hypothetical protein QXU67_06515, partial [Candidatus Bathyarchaeia archaeon]